LTAADVEKVYTLLHQLRRDGLGILYISHRMPEIKALCDTCSVFRNGRHIDTFPAGARTNDEVVHMLIGREIHNAYPPKPVKTEAPVPVLETRGLRWGDRLADISLTVGRGEIVGLGGLDGQGQRDLLLALFGVLRGVEGDILIDGKPCRIDSPRGAKRAGIGMALIPEDRKTEGLLLPMPVGENITLAALGGMTRFLAIDRRKEAAGIERMVEALKIKIGSASAAVGTLSGGNQQKVVIAKWLLTDARIVLLNDPTRGIDVGTKQEIYQLLRDLADAGTAILLYSTDYEELIGCCDRVLILYDGRVIRTLEGEDITETNIVASALNLETDDPALESLSA
jgi:ribose transport system ATP-binding protein